jgi:hypothetical protein
MDVDLKSESAILALAKDLALVGFELEDFLTKEECGGLPNSRGGMLVPNSDVAPASSRQLFRSQETEHMDL